MNSGVDQHALFEHVFKHAPIGIALVSLDGTYMKANPEFCKILGYSEEELTRLTFRDITHPDHLEQDQLLFQALLNGNAKEYETDKRYIQKNGCHLWASIHLSLVRDEIQGTPSYFITHVVDISEKTAAEQKLREVEKLYYMISENALDLITYLTPDGVVQYCSPSIRDILGYEAEEMIGQNSFHYYHPDDIELIRSKFLSDNDVIVYRVRHKNGSYVWCETTIKVNKDEQGDPQQIFGIIRDITARKKYEDHLAEAQRIASLGSWEWDIRNDRFTLSPQVLHILNWGNPYPPVRKSELLALIHPDDEQLLLCNLEQAFEGKDFNVEVRRMETGCPCKYLHLRGAVNFDQEGIPVRMNGTVQDITERKKVEQKLQESVERYTSLKRYNHDAIISLDLHGNIINCNPVAEQMTGYRAYEMAGTSVSKWIGEGNLKSILSGEMLQAESGIDKIVHRNGQMAEVLATIAPIIINQETVGYYIIVKDITEQKQLLIAKEAAEKTNSAKSEFLAMMSHEIRTPMNGVIGMADLLMETYLDAEQREYVEIMKKAGDSLLLIINDILDFSKIESGKTELVEEPFDLSAALTETAATLLPKAVTKNIEIKVSMNPEVPKIVIGDSIRLRQVLMNLISNAIKFTDHGVVSIKAESLKQSDRNVQLSFTVKDTGIGIPKEKVEQLFQPFYQVDNFMTRKTGGTGLGLAISKKLVQLMGGDLWYESSESPGATFVFTVDFQREHQYALPEKSASYLQIVPKPLRILIAEDNEVNQKVLSRVIQRLGYHVTMVSNGNQVLEAIHSEPYDIIFMDIQMPELNGIQATQQIQERFPPAERPYIVAVTADALIGSREKYLEIGMDEYIGKPIKMDIVSQVIANCLNRRS